MRIKNSDRIRVKGPMLIAINHPNAFMDPIVFSWLLHYPRIYYMARGDAFKKGLASWALQSMGLVPIFRLRDAGYESIKKNLESFKIIYSLLDRGKKVVLFAEGLCIQERRLRPIQKGTAKIALSYMEKGGHADITILPVGVTYSTPSKFRGDIFYQVGEPVLVKDYFEEYKQHPAQTIIKLTAEIEKRLKPLVPGLLHKENDLLIEQLQPVLKKQFIREHHLDFNNLEHQQIYWEFITERLNILTEKDPEKMNSFRETVKAYTQQMHELKIRDHLVYKASENKSMLSLINVFMLVAGFPFYVVGKMLNFIPYHFAKKIADKVCKNIEFNASVNIGAGAILLKILFPIELLIVWLIFKSLWALFIYAGIKLVCGIIGLTYSDFKRKMLGAFRFNHIKKSNPALFQSLLQKRQEITTFIFKN